MKKNMPPRQALRRKSTLLLVAGALLSACAGSPRRAPHGDLRFVDTETAGRLRHAAAVGRGASSLPPAATQVVASNLARFVPILVNLLKSGDAVGEFEERLVECARRAEPGLQVSLP